MGKHLQHNGKASSVPGGLLLAAAVSLLLTLMLSGFIAVLLDLEKITWSQAGYLIMGMLFAVSFTGGKCASAAIRRQRAMVCLMAGLVYWGMLLCITALFFGGNFDAVWVTAGVIMAGSGTAALIGMPKTRNRRRRAGKVYR